MKVRRLALISAACAVAVTAGSASMSGAATGQTTAAQSFCSGTAAIPMADLASAVSLTNCHIQGRLVIRDAGGSHMGVHVPAPGHGEGGVAVTKSGDYTLAVTNEDGHVTARTSFPAVQAKHLPSMANSPAMPAATDPACNEYAVAYLGFVWNKTLKWYYNQSTVSRAGLNGPTTRDEIRAANTNMTTGANNCGFPVGKFGSYIGGVPLGAYQGTTSLYANISANAQCTSNFPDGQNTVSWGPFDANTPDLAYTCYNWNISGNDKFAYEADTYLGSNAGIYTSKPANCTTGTDLQTVMTHEWGHSYGLQHESTDIDEVMYVAVFTCSNRRNLGAGDYEGMANLYGVSS